MNANKFKLISFSAKSSEFHSSRWPAIICSDIEPNNFTSYDSDGDIEHYHVEYFGDPRTHSWIHAKEVEIYGSGNAPAPSLLMSHKSMNSARSRKSFQLAVRQADQMIPLKPTERLKHCFYKPVELPEMMSSLANLCGKSISKACFHFKGIESV